MDSARGRSRIVDAASTILLRPRLVADTVLAGYLAMRLFILLFPLAYMAVAGLGLYRRSDGAAEEVATDAGLAPAVTASIVDAANSSSRNHWIALLIGFAGTVWAARGVLRALRAMHALAWGLPAPKTGFKPIGPLLTAATVVAIGLGYSVSDRLQDRSLNWVTAHVVGVLAVSGIWLAASLLLPRAPTRWVALVPGALLFGLGLEGLNLATTIYFAPKATTASAAYGVLGVGLVLLSWLIMVGWLVILAAEVNAGLTEWWHRKGSPEQGGASALDSASEA
jgi:membrane protein